MIVYHSSPEKIEKPFRPGLGYYGHGMYTYDDIELAKKWEGKDSIVYKIDLDIDCNKHNIVRVEDYTSMENFIMFFDEIINNNADIFIYPAEQPAFGGIIFEEIMQAEDSKLSAEEAAKYMMEFMNNLKKRDIDLLCDKYSYGFGHDEQSIKWINTYDDELKAHEVLIKNKELYESIDFDTIV